MSDSNQFGTTGTAVAEPAADEEIGGSVRSKRGLLVAVGVGAVVLAAAAYFLLFSGGGSSDDASSGAVPHTSSSAGGSTAPSASAKPVTSTASSHTSSGSFRDPFAPLVVPSAASSAGSSTGTGSGSGSGTTTGGTVPSGLTETVVLNKVGLSPTSVDVTINGKKYSAQKVGQVFGTYFSLAVVTSTSTATLNFGDSSFTVVLNKAITLRT